MKIVLQKITILTLPLMIAATLNAAHIPSPAIIKRVNELDLYVIPVAHKWNIEPALMKSILAAESAGNHLSGRNLLKSRAGALGAYQLMPRTARYWGNKIGIKLGSKLEARLKWDFSANAEIAAAYISHLINLADKELSNATDWEKLRAVIASYNAGERVITESSKGGGIRARVPAGETIAYVVIVTSYYLYAFEGKIHPQKNTSKINIKTSPKKNETTLKEIVKHRQSGNVNRVNGYKSVRKSSVKDQGSAGYDVLLREIKDLKNNIMHYLRPYSKKVIPLQLFIFAYICLSLIWFIGLIWIYRIKKAV